ncbi:hypothetical protein N657DRAFT_111118 [Parathielavia appendiculata]|uniref:Uncharacterized protein n=1 Tax=Parathielavia appendiculata TaxID=2587402 RepID=A0AAN6Z2H3_9PEZI|nr:hypothetical protein N657DRAFT_111118 [Parathielavia appendiculata]
MYRKSRAPRRSKGRVGRYASPSKDGGKTTTRTLREFVKSTKNSQLGSQLRRDIETLYEHGGIRIGGVETVTPISLSPTKTNFFAVVPARLKPSLLGAFRKQLEAAGGKSEIIAAEVGTAELDAAAKHLQFLAKEMGGPVPHPGQAPTPKP